MLTMVNIIQTGVVIVASISDETALKVPELLNLGPLQNIFIVTCSSEGFLRLRCPMM